MSNSPLCSKFKAKEDVRVWILSKDRKTAMIKNLKKGDVIELKEGESFFEDENLVKWETIPVELSMES